MSILSNVKVQASSIFSTVKETPFAKGVKNVLVEDNLVGRSQSKVMGEIDEASKNLIDSAPELYNKTSEFIQSQTGMKMDSTLSDISKDNIKKMSGANLDKSVDSSLLSAIDKRFKNSPEMLAKQRNTIVQNATAKAAVLGTPLDEGSMNSLLTESAREVDAKMSTMTPLNMAKEYYGKPITSAIDSIQSNGINEEGLRHLGVASARVAATGAVLGAGIGAIDVTAGVTTTAINKLKGNSYER